MPSLFGLFITPFFAHILSKADVGLLYILTTQTQALAVFALLGMDTFYIRSSFENISKERETKLISILLLASLFIFALILAVVFFNIEFLAQIYGISNESNILIYSSFFLIPFESLLGFFLAVLRVKKKYKLLLCSECMRLSIYVLVLYILMYQQDMGILGRNIAAFLSLSPLLFFPIYWLIKNKKILVDRVLTIRVMAFSKYWIPSTFILTFMPLFDRAFILFFINKEAVASFSIAFSLAGVCRLLGLGLTRYCEPLIFSQDPREPLTALMSELESSFVRVIAYATSLAIIAVPLIYSLVMPAEYQNDLLLCSLIMIAAISTFLSQFSSSRITALYDSKTLFLIHTFSLVLKFSIAIPLIIKYEVVGFAMACMLEGLIYFVGYKYFDPQKNHTKHLSVLFEISIIIMSGIYLQSVINEFILAKNINWLMILFLIGFMFFASHKILKSIIYLLNVSQEKIITS